LHILFSGLYYIYMATETVDKLTERQRELLKLMNPLEYGFNQHESAMVMGLSERQVNRIFRQFKIQFPEAAEHFIKLKKATNRLRRRVRHPWILPPDRFGQDTLQNLKIVRIWK